MNARGKIDNRAHRAIFDKEYTLSYLASFGTFAMLLRPTYLVRHTCYVTYFGIQSEATMKTVPGMYVRSSLSIRVCVVYTTLLLCFSVFTA